MSTFSHAAERALAGVPQDFRNLLNWPSLDTSQFAPAERNRCDRLSQAIEAKLAGQSNDDAAAIGQIAVRAFQRIFRRCLAHHPDGSIWGFRALPKGTRVQVARRVSPQRSFEDKPSAGYAGLFKKLLADNPSIESDLVYKLTTERRQRPSMNKMSTRHCHNIFLDLCKDCGVQPDQYPFNTQHKGRRAFRAWMQTEFLVKYASAWVRAQEGESASQVFDYQGGDGSGKALLRAYKEFQADEVTIDLHAMFELLNGKGDWEELALRRCSAIRWIESGNATTLSWRLVLAPQPSAEDLLISFWDALNGPPKVASALADLDYGEGAGYPANVHPALKFALPEKIKLDNALSHLQGPFQRLLAGTCGIVVELGAPRTPQARAEVEAKFKLQATRVVHQLPGTSGSGPHDPVRKKAAVPVSKRVRVDELEHVLDVYIANENATASARAGYESPLERLRRQLAAGVIRPKFLPVARRKPHFFNGVHPVKVKFDSKNHRRPFINFLGARYSSPQLHRGYALKGQQLWARFDPRDLRTLLLFLDDGTEYGAVTALGQWGKFQHNVRVRKLYLQLKRRGELGARPEDAPLEALFNHLRAGAPADRTKALQLAGLMKELSGPIEGTESMQDVVAEERHRQAALDAFEAVAMKTPDELPQMPSTHRYEPASNASPISISLRAQRLPRRAIAR